MSLASDKSKIDIVPHERQRFYDLRSETVSSVVMGIHGDHFGEVQLASEKAEKQRIRAEKIEKAKREIEAERAEAEKAKETREAQ